LVEKGDFVRWVYGRILGRPMNFSFVDESVAGSAGPLTRREGDWLRNKQGIGAILSVREGPLVKLWVEGIEYLNVPIKNHAVPTVPELVACIDFIMGQVSSGKRCAVHCAMGRGRTGTVIACYFCRRYALSAEEAIFKVRKLRPGSIERKQGKAVFDYCNKIREIPKSSREPSPTSKGKLL
jgi:atypical dual specificity phosphatase